MSQWTEEVLQAIHNIGAEGCSEMTDYIEAVKAFSDEELRILQMELTALKKAVRQQQSLRRRSPK